MGESDPILGLTNSSGQKKKESEKKGIQHPCTAPEDKTSRTPSRVENHRAEGPNVVVGTQMAEEETPLRSGSPQAGEHAEAAAPSHPANKKERARKKAYQVA